MPSDSVAPPSWGDPELLVNRPVPDVGRVDRLRGAVGRRRVVPTAVALWATDLVYGTATRVLGGRRAYAEATMRAVLPPGTPDSEVARLAPRHATSTARAWELTWRPDDLLRMPVRGLEHLEAARASGRGILVSYVHYGPELGWVRAARELPMLVVLGDWIENPTPAGYNGLQVEHRRSLLREAGFPLVAVRTATRRMLTVLKQGGAVLLAMDVPGPHPTRYLGKDVEMADGTARLAATTKALILPGAFVPDGRRWVLEFLPALDPAEYTGPDELHQALADVHSEVVLRAPEHAGSPLRPGFWAAADEHRWVAEAP